MNSSHAQHGTYSIEGAVPTAWRGEAVDIVRPLGVHPLYTFFLVSISSLQHEPVAHRPHLPPPCPASSRTPAGRPTAAAMARAPTPTVYPPSPSYGAGPSPIGWPSARVKAAPLSNTVTCHDSPRHPRVRRQRARALTQCTDGVGPLVQRPQHRLKPPLVAEGGMPPPAGTTPGATRAGNGGSAVARRARAGVSGGGGGRRCRRVFLPPGATRVLAPPSPRAPIGGEGVAGVFWREGARGPLAPAVPSRVPFLDVGRGGGGERNAQIVYCTYSWAGGAQRAQRGPSRGRRKGGEGGARRRGRHRCGAPPCFYCAVVVWRGGGGREGWHHRRWGPHYTPLLCRLRFVSRIFVAPLAAA